jgi:cytochrome P450
MTSGHQPRNYPFGEAEALLLDEQLVALREQPLARVRLPYGGDAWLATRYADVRTVLGDPRFSRAAAGGREDMPRATSAVEAQTGILTMDPPEHTRLRRLVAKAFTANRVRDLRPRTERIADDLLDRMIAAGPPADLVEHFALPLPITVICELLGVPTADQASFRAWTDRALAITAFTPQEIDSSRRQLREYIAGLIARRRRVASDDLLSALVRARDDEDRLSEAEMVDLGVGLLIAGHETTANQISNFVYTLLTHPAELADLLADLNELPAAVEELLRFTPLGGSAGFARIATEDIELGGTLVRAGEAVFVEMATANRDPSVFTHANELDLKRASNPHMGFGHGVHHCLGAQLARMELQVALYALLTRLPRLSLAIDEKDVPWRRGRRVRGPQTLPVTWSKAIVEVGHERDRGWRPVAS